MSIANPHFADAFKDPAQRRLQRNAAMASLGVCAVLIAAKTFAFATTDSVAMLSSLLDSAFDAFASMITLFGVLHAAQPADEQHRYGHGKAEALSSLAQAVFVIASASLLFYEAFGRLRNPQPVEMPMTGIAVTVLAIVLTLGLVRFQKHVIRKTGSVAITGDNMHYKADLLMNLGVIATLALTALTGRTEIDAVFAIAVALHLLRVAWGIGTQAVDILMDRELPEATRAEILAQIKRHPAAISVHDLRTRNTGERFFIEFHLEMDGSLTLHQAHAATEEIERILFDAFPASEVLIHQEPAGLDDHRLDHQVGGNQST